MPERAPARKSQTRGKPAGKLRIGDDWNAISIIALAQSNPLKAVAEFVENSIDAGARNITIVRGREQGETYLLIRDDGSGVRPDSDGVPDFEHVATHICDSFKRRLKSDGVRGIQGEFGIGLLSFWTLGETLRMTSAAQNGANYQMQLRRDDPAYRVGKLRTLLPIEGTELKVKPLLPGIRGLTGEKLQAYLAAELRDRIHASGVNIQILDKQARKEFKVVPREFSGLPLRELATMPTANGDIQLELYFTDSGTGQVGLYRSGTRVLESLTELDEFGGTVWASGLLEGVVEASFLSLTPGTRNGIIRDAQYRSFVDGLAPATRHLDELVESHRRAEDEKASVRLQKRLQRAFREAILALPVEDYDWFDVRRAAVAGVDVGSGSADAVPGEVLAGNLAQDDLLHGSAVDADTESEARQQTDFFDFPGPLYSVRVSPQSAVLGVGQSRVLRAIARDRNRRSIGRPLMYVWEVVAGGATLVGAQGEQVEVVAGTEPGLVQLQVMASENGVDGEVLVIGTASITVTDELVSGAPRTTSAGKGLPGYTFTPAPSELWRSRYDEELNLIVINNGHRDFVYANRSGASKLRYVARLFAKELVRKNFPGATADELLERMIELTLYMEEHLR